MLEVLKDLPPGVIGFEAIGKVDAQDYETVLKPAVEAAAALGGIRVVYVFGDRFEGYSAGAVWQDAKLGLANIRSWARTAIVSDRDWVENMVEGLGWMMPGTVRHFDDDELDDAIEWVADKDNDKAGDVDDDLDDD